MAAFGLALGLAACSPEPAVIDLGIDQIDAPFGDEVQSQLAAATDAAVAATGSTGAIVGVYAPWAGQWVAGVGTVSPGGAATDAGLTFKATAVTRSMTCDVLYALVDNGTVELDDTVTEWLDTYPNVADITLEQLCDSTSGLHAYMGEIQSRLIANPERVWNPREIAAYGLAQDRTSDPGARFRDSDTGYVMLGIVLERASGRTMSELYREYVFEPLGMTGSSFPSAAGDGADWLGGFYSTNEDGKPNCAAPRDLTSLSPSAGGAASGVVSTVGDLATYVRALATGARSYDADTRFADARPTGEDQPTWFTSDGGTYQAGSLIGQHGNLPGYMTAAYADRETGMTVVVVLNNSRASNAVSRLLAWQLAAIASKAPAAEGRTAPEIGLPWTAESLADQVQSLAICGD
ncbi:MULTISPECIES: serine hydrolase domain-containing protein [unclassified Microbacterium]|uniref:serine hydrolase domain-containing protein n=1 Tax=unclassified Microbacterium TaxID=2609290 RepID=UPI00386CD2C9